MISESLRNRARELRANATPFEQSFWQAIRAHRFSGFKFRRQQVIGNYIADFACMQARLIVELDGGQHADATAYDSRRDAWLKAEGYRVFRVWNNEWTHQQEAVLERLWALLHEDHSPLPSGERGWGIGSEAAPPSPQLLPASPPSPQPLPPDGGGARPASLQTAELLEAPLPRSGGGAGASLQPAKPLEAPLSLQGRGAGGEGGAPTTLPQTNSKEVAE
jgi:very-short-patch-repair endonuclease